MPTYIDKVQLELSQISVKDLIRPAAPVPRCMVLAGKLSEDMKRLYTLKRRTELEFAERQEDLQTAVRIGKISPKRLQDEARLATEVLQRAATLAALLEASIADEFQLWGHQCFRVCGDWQVCYCGKETETELVVLLEGKE